MAGIPQAAKTWTGTLALASLNPVIGAASTEAEKILLEKTGNEKVAAGYDPLDPVARGIDGVLGLAFGAMGKYHQARAKMKTETKDSIDTVANWQRTLKDTPFDTENPKAQDLSSKAMSKALTDLSQGKPVDLSEVLPDQVPLKSGVRVEEVEAKAALAEALAMGDAERQALEPILPSKKALELSRAIPGKDAELLTAGELRPGDSFERNGEKFTVTDVTPLGKVKLADGIKIDVPEGQTILADQGSVKLKGSEQTPWTRTEGVVESEIPDDLSIIGNAGKAITDNLYKGLFDSLQKGKSTFAGIEDPVLFKSKGVFDSGLITSPDDLKTFVNSGYDVKSLSSASSAVKSESLIDSPVAQRMEARFAQEGDFLVHTGTDALGSPTSISAREFIGKAKEEYKPLSLVERTRETRSGVPAAEEVAPSRSAKEIMPVTPSQRTSLETVRNYIQHGEQAIRRQVDYDDAKARGEMATGPWQKFEPNPFPDYFKGKGYKKKETLTWLDKALSGEPLTERQRDVVSDLMSEHRSKIAAQFTRARAEMQGGGYGDLWDNPVVQKVEERFAEGGDFPIHTGTDALGSPTSISAREFIGKAKEEYKALEARKDIYDRISKCLS
jgi:hypothetical protein